ncbi:IclR family transcriptional regulator [Paenibacillus sp. BC26]|uniref:IclR family transcriptional regulator n=1 Tax=Paenibacillus sp. BC26 TaxID=1881032 RepID=UPI0008E679B9|nr:IclR family transcriptional regulator [Paenibacillus sp. BC26]SFS66538.1 transcriptional regulator, IclR family [Paenibacillus sp. BC26]
MSTKKDYSVPALEKAIMILNEISVKGELSITEMHLRLQIPKSTTFVILNTLEKHHLIEKAYDGKFRLGPAVFQLGMSYTRQTNLLAVARPHLERLIQGTPYTTHLAILIDNQPVYIDKVEGEGFVRFATKIGQSLPLHASGVGKALAAGMADEDIAAAVERKLEPLTDKSYRTVEQVLEDIRAVRKLGYAIEDEQMEEGIRCIGAPIYGPDAKVIASLSVTALAKDLPMLRIQQVGERVKEIAGDISRDLGYVT